MTASGRANGQCLPDAVAAFRHQRQLQPQRHGGGGQRSAGRRVAVRGESPIERRAQIVELPRIIGAPFSDRPCLQLRFLARENRSRTYAAWWRATLARSPAFLELLQRVGAGRVEQPEPRFRPTDIGGDQRFRHQIDQTFNRTDVCCRRVNGNGRGGLAGKAAREYMPSARKNRLLYSD